jgi:hypothetical protein
MSRFDQAGAAIRGKRFRSIGTVRSVVYMDRVETRVGLVGDPACPDCLDRISEPGAPAVGASHGRLDDAPQPPELLVRVGVHAVRSLWLRAKAEQLRDRVLWPVCAAIGVVLLGIQISGGRFRLNLRGIPTSRRNSFPD